MFNLSPSPTTVVPSFSSAPSFSPSGVEAPILCFLEALLPPMISNGELPEI